MLLVNMLLESYVEEGKKKIERILWLDYKDDLVFVIDILANKLPYYRILSDVTEGVQEGMIRIVETESFFPIRRDDELSEIEKEARIKAWSIIKDLVEQKPQIFDFKERRRLIKEFAQKFQVNERTIVNYLIRYWKRGSIPNALIPNFKNCGGRGKEKNAGFKKRGRPSKNGKTGVNVDDKVKKIFRQAINKWYYNSSQKSLTLTYELMRKEYFNDGYKTKDGLKIPILKPSDEVPTIEQFIYWFKKERNIKKEITTRRSAKKYEQQFRPVIGVSTKEAIGPGSLYQVDSTVANIYLVSSYNRNWIIGRPIVTVCIDVFSRMVTGLYVGLEGPSYMSTSLALINAATNKVNFCKEYGIEIKEEDWPVSGLPENILADRGELAGKNIEGLINGLQIRVQNTPPYRADWKGIIEQHFRITNLRTKPFLPGAVNSNFKERGDKDYRLKAKLTLYEFTQIMIKCVLYHNNKHYLSHYCRQEMMIEDNLKPIPRTIWNWGIENKGGKLKFVNEEEVRLNLLPTDLATVTAKGIKFKGLLYSSRITLKERWFEKARSSGSWKVDIWYDPRNMNYIYLKESDTNKVDKCFLLEHQNRYRDRAFDDLQYLIAKERIQVKESKDEELQDKVELITEIENIVANANKEAKNEISNESDTQRKKGIKDNRKFEIEMAGTKPNFELDMEKCEKDRMINSLEKNQQDDSDYDTDFLSRKQKEALKK